MNNIACRLSKIPPILHIPPPKCRSSLVALIWELWVAAKLGVRDRGDGNVVVNVPYSAEGGPNSTGTASMPVYGVSSDCCRGTLRDRHHDDGVIYCKSGSSYVLGLSHSRLCYSVSRVGSLFQCLFAYFQRRPL